MEMTMNSTYENSQPVIRELADEELDVASGGNLPPWLVVTVGPYTVPVLTNTGPFWPF
jgi:hypothetical protein